MWAVELFEYMDEYFVQAQALKESFPKEVTSELIIEGRERVVPAKWEETSQPRQEYNGRAASSSTYRTNRIEPVE